MAKPKSKVTSSSNRSNRSTNKPITKGQNPQRANRQAVSNASVSSSEMRDPNRVRAGLNQSNKPNGGRVTGTTGRLRPATPATVTSNTSGSSGNGGGNMVRRPSSLPAQRGGPMTQSPRGQATSNRVDQVRVRDMGTTKPQQMGGATPGRPTPATPPRSLPAGRAGGSLAIRANRPGLTAAVASLAAPVVDAAAQGIANAYGRAVNRERSQRAAESGQRGRYVPGNQQVKFEKPKPPAVKPPASVPSRSSAAPQRSASPARVSNPAPKAAAKAVDKKPTEKAYGESGKDLYMASKKNNPLMKRTFGYQTGDAPDQKKKKP